MFNYKPSISGTPILGKLHSGWYGRHLLGEEPTFEHAAALVHHTASWGQPRCPFHKGWLTYLGVQLRISMGIRRYNHGYESPINWDILQALWQWLHYLITGSAPPSNGMMRKSIPWESQERHLDDCIQTYRHFAVTADSYLDRETNVFNMDCLWEAQWLIMSLCSCLIQSIEMGLSNNRGTLNHQF